MTRQEFVFSLVLVKIFTLFSSNSICCSCGSLVDNFEGHVLGCGHEPMRIHKHNTLCDIVFMFFFRTIMAVRGSNIQLVIPVWIVLAVYVILNFCMVATSFDVFVHT